jgi:RNase adapter protein RapZ
MRIILVTGMSGSGKSVALHALEDAGYYCIDNLPPHFLSEVIDFFADDTYARLAVAIDARSRCALSELPDIIRLLRASHQVDMLFLNANTQTLIQRFSETRRRHPLSIQHTAVSEKRSTLADAIEHERELIAHLADLGQQIDTSALRAHVLCLWVKQFVANEHTGLTVSFESFGFKHGLPLDADFVFDARMLPNPYYDHRLATLSGLDPAVVDFFSAAPEVAEMIDDIELFLRKWIPRLHADQRSYLTVAVGCTGGQHRSVHITQMLAKRLSDMALVLVRHREIAQAAT